MCKSSTALKEDDVGIWIRCQERQSQMPTVLEHVTANNYRFHRK